MIRIPSTTYEAAMRGAPIERLEGWRPPDVGENYASLCNNEYYDDYLEEQFILEQIAADKEEAARVVAEEAKKAREQVVVKLKIPHIVLTDNSVANGQSRQNTSLQNVA